MENQNLDINIIIHQIGALTALLQVANAISDTKLKTEVSEKISELINKL